jgi:uncharacterized NAD-dependent epimerase/dehydratase family protein
LQVLGVPKIEPHHRVAILLNGGIRGLQGKTGLTMLRYSNANIVAVIDPDCVGQHFPSISGIQREVPIVDSVAAALAYQPEILAIGIAPSGGIVPDSWFPELQTALAGGLSIVNGLHTALATHPLLQGHLQGEQWIWDVRQEPAGLRIGSGKARESSARRVLMVGTDMAIGKMSAALEIQRSADLAGVKAKFLATGQAGIMISGEGVALDAIKVDYAAGAIEGLVLDAGDGWDVLLIEGQGSLLHPGSTATLPLIRGSQPTHLILVHRALQETIRNCPHVKIPPLPEVIQLYESVATAAGAFSAAKVVAIAVNSGHLDEPTANAEIQRLADLTGLPCIDGVRSGAAGLLESVMA